VGEQRAVWLQTVKDRELWTRAQQVAKERRQSMSALVLTALETYLEASGAEDKIR
jgi:hypothetical protein